MNSLAKLFFAFFILSLSGCVLSPEPSEQETSSVEEVAPTREADTGDRSSNNSVEAIPPEWSQTEKQIFESYVLFYPETREIDLQGKRALMDNAHLICQAYGEGYSRIEIQSAITGGSVTSQMSDDWMTLSVTYLCPEFFDLHR